MKTIAELWAFMGNCVIDGKPMPDRLKRDIQSFCLSGIQALPEIQANTATDNSVRRPETGFKWSKASFKELEGVKYELADVATRALLCYTTIDFCCFDGIRTRKEQQQYVANGKSKTMQSKHLDGLAVDLVPIVNGTPKWDWTLIYQVAFAMDQAATELGFANHIRWGGAWDRTLADFGGSKEAYQKECQDYSARHPGSDFLDGPHFEWRD